MKQGGFPERIWTSRPARIVFLAAALLLLATMVPPAPLAPPPGPEIARLTIAPLPLDASDPGRRRVGALVFLGGWALASDNPRFGGISAMHVEGGRVIAVNDAGTLLRFPLPGSGPARVRIDSLPAGPAAHKRDRDSEALAIRGGSAWVAFERHNLVRRYRRADWRVEASAAPPAMRRWGRNSGAEALVRLPGGRFLALAEGPDDGGAFSEAILFDGDPAVAGTRSAKLRYRRAPGFRVTDAALLPDGRLLLLNRRFTWLGGWAALLSIAPAPALAAGGTIEARAIAELRAPLTVDNMEALSVTVEGGRTIVWIASDDNLIALQRTLLLKFALDG